MKTAKNINKHDIEINTVYNGYSAKIDRTVFVFSSLSELTEWLKDNIDTPKRAKTLVDKFSSKKVTDYQTEYTIKSDKFYDNMTWTGNSITTSGITGNIL